MVYSMVQEWVWPLLRAAMKKSHREVLQRARSAKVLVKMLTKVMLSQPLKRKFAISYEQLL